jgi:hypothetical protein
MNKNIDKIIINIWILLKREYEKTLEFYQEEIFQKINKN